jgi:L-ascorbate metabolism protein UlaG (beta-lactamase superfamily)
VLDDVTHAIDSCVTIRYLGVAGWQLATPSSSLLVDPYFTRMPPLRVAFGRAVPDSALIATHTPPADAVLVTHPHYDHLMDVPEAARASGGRVYASAQGCALLDALGVPAETTQPIAPGDRLEIGDFAVEVYPSTHRTILGRIPYLGPLRAGLRPPLRASDYRIDQLFSFRVTAGGVRVLIASGIDDEPQVAADVLMVGADASREQLARILEGARPRVVMPNHWDNMFRSLSRPARPMIKPPRRLIPAGRIDLDAWRGLVREIAPEARVVIPAWFEPVAVGEMLAEG